VPAEPLQTMNVYHVWYRGETNPADGRGHDLSLGCWCEPHPHDFGADAAGHPVLVVNHHVPPLWCCATHRRARIYATPRTRARTGPTDRAAGGPPGPADARGHAWEGWA
jgi:hypothetical protein